MNDATPPRLTQANRQMNDLIRGLMLLQTDLKSQSKPVKIGMLLRLEALERDARAVELTLELMTRDARSEAFKEGGERG
ncbi:MAG: hypothetical protein CFE33_15220 [Pseudorhodobacter sp. PARRP1]|nr:MAG: hypothetical protein CFE33_15220 [Pseudorhodobacter sp. PARRP1]